MHGPSRKGAGLVAGSLAAALVLLTVAAPPAAAVPGSDSAVFINEFHYDNDGADTNEFIEVAGPAGTNLSGWSIVLYNGSTPGAAVTYGSIALSGTIPGESGYGVVAVAATSLQNGTNDGFALVNGSTVVQLLSYEGSFTAAAGAGPAAGMTSTDVGVSQPSTAPLNSSLHLTGSGSTYGDFTWAVSSGTNTRGATNTGQTFGTALPPPPPPGGVCGDPVVKIHQIQGSGATFNPAYSGSQSIEGVVTDVIPALSGYYLQEEPADQDAEPATSEGIFVRSGSTADIAIGQSVRAHGSVAEFRSTTGAGSSQTQLSGTVTSTVCAEEGAAVAPVGVSFPLTSVSDLERYEGMLVQLTDELVLSESFNYDRFGEVVVAKPLDGLSRLYTPTAVVEPGEDARALAAQYALRRITIDDRNGTQNPATIPHPGNGEPFGQDNLFRAGDTITGISGVVDHTFGLYRLQPTVYGDYVPANPRPQNAPAVGGDVQVASFNVLNYFLTLDAGTNKCGPTRELDCRGANTSTEFQRQRAKILDALTRLNADVVGLMEMENTTGVEPAADLVAGLNARLGAGTYAYVDTGTIGTDAIRLGLLYKPAVVRPAGRFVVLDSSVDPRFIDTKSRPMLTQTFDEIATGGRFTVSVNHLKSKGSSCGSTDPDTGDGSGNCNITRTQAAEAIVDFLATDPTQSGDPDHLIIGDLNAYDHEDPIDVLVAGGYADQIKRFGGEYAYGYVFDGQVGYLDHALSSSSLDTQVTGAAEWHINADEPDILDYNLDFSRPSTFYAADAYRSSDHDAVLVGLDLAGVTPERCYSDGSQTVESFAQGNLANGRNVPPATSDPSQALGRSNPNPDDPYWVSLGLRGEIVLEFARAFQNNNGAAADLQLHEVFDGAKGSSDAALVYASYDGVTWQQLGRVAGSGQLDLGLLQSAHFVKVVDDTRGKLSPAADGYDLDAIEVRTGCV